MQIHKSGDNNLLQRVTEYNNTRTEYTYDAAGNRLTKKVTRGGNVTTTAYQYGAANQLTSAGGVNYTYDDNGNMTGDGTRTYVYDAANRLLEVKQGATVIALFAYDADGRRTSMTTSSGTVRFFYDGASTRVLYETDGSGNLLARYVYGPGGQLLAMVRGGVTYYYHYNGHGDVVALTNAAGTVVATYEYDAFGNHLGSTGSVNNPYRYAGYRWDAETGLYYLNARYYMPSVGRFITRDAFHGFENDPASLNWYNYAHSNPVMLTDPSGYSPWISTFSIVLGIAAHVLLIISPMSSIRAGYAMALAGAQAAFALFAWRNAVTNLNGRKLNRTEHNRMLSLYTSLLTISLISAAISGITAYLKIPTSLFLRSTKAIIANFGIALPLNLIGVSYDAATLLNTLIRKPRTTAFHELKLV